MPPHRRPRLLLPLVLFSLQRNDASTPTSTEAFFLPPAVAPRQRAEGRSAGARDNNNDGRNCRCGTRRSSSLGRSFSPSSLRRRQWGPRNRETRTFLALGGTATSVSDAGSSSSPIALSFPSSSSPSRIRRSTARRAAASRAEGNNKNNSSNDDESISKDGAEESDRPKKRATRAVRPGKEGSSAPKATAKGRAATPASRAKYPSGKRKPKAVAKKRAAAPASTAKLSDNSDSNAVFNDSTSAESSDETRNGSGEGDKGSTATAGGGQPPRYDGSALARTVFADPYFYMSPLAAADRQDDRLKNLGDFTVRQALEKFYTDAAKTNPPLQVHPLDALTTAIGARPSSTSEYFSTADMETKKYFAAMIFKAKYKGDFSECVIEIGSMLGPLLPVTPVGDDFTQQSDQGRLIDMSFLDPLRSEIAERFLIPSTAYVRDCMRMIFALFLEDIESNKKAGAKNAVLIGSPGVGKSILFFLAALYQAQRRPIVYHRITKTEDEKASLFFVAPEGDGKIRVWFTRNMDEEAIQDITGMRFDIERELDIRREDYYVYIDGPNQVDENYLMKGRYDYFCTSGGFRRYKKTERGKRLWILDGWTREEAIDGLEALGHDKAKAAEVYWLCGGNIRDLLAACVSMEPIREELDLVVDQQGIESIKLALLSTERRADPLSPDSLRTMFLSKEQQQRSNSNWKGVMHAVQIVDSEYALDRLANKMTVEAFLESYRFCLNYGMQAGAGNFFERIIHQSVMSLKRSPVKSVCWSVGKTAESFRQLDDSGIYWIPSVSNFVSIDSALAHHHTLYSFQMTIKDRRDFNVVAFRSKFANIAKKALSANAKIDTLVVYVVVPEGGKFDSLKCLKFTDGKNPEPEPEDIEFRIHRVNMKDLGTISKSIRQLMSGLQSQTGRPTSSWK